MKVIVRSVVVVLSLIVFGTQISCSNDKELRELRNEKAQLQTEQRTLLQQKQNLQWEFQQVDRLRRQAYNAGERGGGQFLGGLVNDNAGQALGGLIDSAAASQQQDKHQARCYAIRQQIFQIDQRSYVINVQIGEIDRKIANLN
ncbi:hypothetical protein SAMN02745181_1171 [Rubritalea squalenifaciens DSM 18772]|uniref:Uncharacterized protein n=1 Tax=Rubritalea squalenifaciens DSM 18772 TaxID=1123071 RepID=A0A1M6GHJ2_9BACT|nr:hypothetical protein [Rubritalea squalenifaciens]SHJ09348.1 hypothetical protein SAMN02745181_1171 [Rubritalea squalenifaciens DSM 18772]